MHRGRADKTAFARAARILRGEAFLDRAEAILLGDALSPAERGRLLPLAWGTGPQAPKDAKTVAQAVLTVAVLRNDPAPVIMPDALSEVIAQLGRDAASDPPSWTEAHPGNDTRGQHARACGLRLWRTLTLSVAPPSDDDAVGLCALLARVDIPETARHLAVARIAGSQTADTMLRERYLAEAASPVARAEAETLLRASPWDFLRWVALQDMPDADERSDHRMSVLDQVPGYPDFARETLHLAETRLAAIRSGNAAYAADGAFPVTDCHAILRAMEHGLWADAPSALAAFGPILRGAVAAPDPAVRTMPSQSLSIGLANAAVAQPRPAVLGPLAEAAAICRHAGVKKKLDRLSRSARSALSARPDRVLDLDPGEPVPKDLARAFRDGVEALLADPTGVHLQDWMRRFGPHRGAGWHIARALIWQAISGGGAAACLTVMPVLERGEVVWAAVDGSARAVGPGDAIHLWHPVETPVDLAVAWQARLERVGAVQPFAQAAREVYQPDATEMAGTRIAAFAGRAVSARPLVGLARTTGWRFGFQDELTLRLQGVEFRFEAGVRVYPGSEGVGVAGDMTLVGPQTRLNEVPARIVSEAMRRVDLLVTVAGRGISG